MPGTDIVQPEPIDFHWGVMLIDVEKKQLSSAPLGQDPSTDAIDSVTVADDAILLHGLGKKDTNRTWSAVISIGAGLTIPQIAEPLRNARLVVLALLANFVVMPLGALALARVLWLDEPFGIGLLLLGCAAGAPFLPKLAELAKGNLAFAVGAMVLLMVVTVGYLPIVLPLLLPGVTVNAVGDRTFPSAVDVASRLRWALP